MKTTLFALLLLAACPVLRAEAPTVVTPEAPLVETNGMVELLMADGSARRVRKLTGLTPDSLKIMTDDGIGKIPLNALHPATLAAVNSLRESPEEAQARMQREASAAQTYRENQDRKAAENAALGANQRAEAARQAEARRLAAEAYQKQQQQYLEAMKIQEMQRANRLAEIAEKNRIEERRRQYNLDAAAVRALQGLSDAAQLEVLRKLGYIR